MSLFKTYVSLVPLKLQGLLIDLVIDIISSWLELIWSFRNNAYNEGIVFYVINLKKFR